MRPKGGLALTAILPAVLVPTTLPALREAGASDLAIGLVVGMLLGASLLLLALAVRRARRD